MALKLQHPEESNSPKPHGPAQSKGSEVIEAMMPLGQACLLSHASYLVASVKHRAASNRAQGTKLHQKQHIDEALD
jgi:hypothetical protein